MRWATFAMVSVLIANLGICISAVRRHRRRVLRTRPRPKVPLDPDRRDVRLALLLIRGSYRVAERIFVLMTIPFFAYPIAAILARPHWGVVGKAMLSRQALPAQLRSTIVPLHRDGGHHDHAVHAARTSSRRSCRTEHRHRSVETPSAPKSRRARSSRTSSQCSSSSPPAPPCMSTATTRSTTPRTRRTRSLRLPGVTPKCSSGSAYSGLGLLAAAILPVTAAYVISETFGFEKGIRHRPREAPVFVGVITILDRGRNGRRADPGHPRASSSSSPCRS